MKKHLAVDCPRLIEVALPIREISAESVRDKNIHHAHISLLHIWWARRPIPASRAVVFASLVPDPDDPLCPKAFCDAVERYLKLQVPPILKGYKRGTVTVPDADPYRPYPDLEDTLRNRLFMFIAKWSPSALEFERGETATPPKPTELLDARCLVRWETSDLRNAQGVEILKLGQELVRIASGGQTPVVLDPFAGGGAIPLEVGRLGGKAIANEYNPVAHLLLKATCEYPQEFGKPRSEGGPPHRSGSGGKTQVELRNALVADLDRWANWILDRVKGEVGGFYPAGSDGRPVLGYLWARTTPCSNPSCARRIPLIRSLQISTKGKKTTLTMKLDHAEGLVHFAIAQGKEIHRTEGTKRERAPAICPFCEQPTPEADIRRAGKAGLMGEQLLAVVVDSGKGKDFREVEPADLQALEKISTLPIDVPHESILPEITKEHLTQSNSTGIRVHLYGMESWGSLFNRRQLVTLQSFITSLHKALQEIDIGTSDSEYRGALATYLGLWLDRIVVFNNTVSRWRPSHEKSETPFSGQAIPMIWDYPEVNPLADTSGSASTQLRYMLKVIEHEQVHADLRWEHPEILLGSATSLSLQSEAVDAVVTDPPYDDAISYADLSDFFYVWLKRSIGDRFSDIFRTPLTPKSEEATSLRHRHEGSIEKARAHYRRLLEASFRETLRVARQPKLVTVMFAHQSTEAWTALMSALMSAGLAPTATWPIATEMPKTALALGTASLETSVTVACRPRIAGSAASYKDLRKEIEAVVEDSVKRFWGYGFRGADLIVACYGPAVGVFARHERVEKADGTRVEVAELLELARSAARDAIAGEFRGDSLSTIYYVWANLYGPSEQDWDDARLVVQMGGDTESAMELARTHGVFIVDGSKVRLSLLADRAGRRALGNDPNPPLIDALHRSMLLWKEERRTELVSYLGDRGFLDDGAALWKLAQALFEVLPRDSEDWKLATALLGERDSLRTQAKRSVAAGAQQRLFQEEGR